jgi:hypothetical protein
MAEKQKLETQYFADDGFLIDNIHYVQKYAELRIRGVHNLAAFRRVFGAINCVDYQETHNSIQNLEASDTYNDIFEAKLKAAPVDTLLSERKALHGYLDIFHNPMLKESVRVAALKEACVIAGVTVIDDKGNTKRRGLGDYYREVETLERKLESNRDFVAKGKPLPGDTPTTH